MNWKSKVYKACSEGRNLILWLNYKLLNKKAKKFIQILEGNGIDGERYHKSKK